MIVNGGSSAVEAGACGKHVICLGPSTYQQSGFVQTFTSKSDMEQSGLRKVDEEEIRRKTLRFVYVRSHRHPQYVNYVLAKETTEYEYFEGGDSQRTIEMLRTGLISPDDANYSPDARTEDRVLKMLKAADWGALAAFESSPISNEVLRINRRFLFRWIDAFRKKFKRGDR